LRRLEKMEIEKKEAQDLKAAEARLTCVYDQWPIEGGLNMGLLFNF
jgi:hypothetical protein